MTFNDRRCSSKAPREVWLVANARQKMDDGIEFSDED